MAYRRCIAARTKQLYEQQRISPSFWYTNHHDDTSKKPNSIPNRSYGTFHFSNIEFQGHRFSSPFNSGVFGSVLSRNMCTSAGADKAELMSNMDALVDGTLSPVLNEVAVAAADSFLPIAALQFVINYVHVTTGLNWWAAIALTTLGIRFLMIPFTVNQLKATTKYSLMSPKLEEIKQEMQDKGMSQEAVSEGQEKMQGLFKEHKVTPFTPMKGALITGPVFICFFLAVQNMAQKVPSFQHGGAYWFLDLTTPDSMYILPVVMALTFLLTVELNSLEGMEGTTGKTIKNVCRGFAVLSVPMTASFAKAIFCYWITANLYSLVYGMVIKKPEVKKFLGIPIVPVRPPSPTDQQNSGLSFFETIKKMQVAAKQNSEIQAARLQSLATSSPAESSEGMNQKKPSSAILSQRTRSLEKGAKGKKKGGKKR